MQYEIGGPARDMHKKTPKQLMRKMCGLALSCTNVLAHSTCWPCAGAMCKRKIKTLKTALAVGHRRSHERGGG